MPGQTMPGQALPPLPPRLASATLAAADTLTAIAASEGLELGDEWGEPRPPLRAMLAMLRERCLEAELEPQPWLSDRSITPAEIAAVLETIGQVMLSDELDELVGRNPSWFTDAALVVERLGSQE